MNKPQMIPGQVEMVSVEWILKNAESSVDAVTFPDGSVDYLKMARRKGSDSQFPALVSTIMERGFRVPIVLCLDYETSDGVFKNVVHGNGHHRMIAALLLALDEIPVYWSKFDGFMCIGKSESEPMDYALNLVAGLWDADEEGPWGFEW